MSIYEELLQNIQYSDISEEAVVSLLRTEAVLMGDFDQMVRQFGVTPAQYNILRILRGAHRKGERLGRNEIRRRLIDRISPDLSRMLTRLEKMGLVARDRNRPETADQRVIPVEITEQGLELLAAMDQPLRERNARSMGQLSESEQRQLIELLSRIRQQVHSHPPVAHLRPQGATEPAESGDAGDGPAQ